MGSWDVFDAKNAEELISIFQSEYSNSEEKTQAFELLCNLFRRDVLNKCEIICKRFGHGVSVAEDIANRTFSSYAKKPNYLTTESRAVNVETGFKLYLYGIAQRELVNHHRTEERKRKGGYYEGNEQIVTSLPDIDIDRLGMEERIKFEAINSLSPKLRTIYLTYELHERVGFNLPRKLLTELRKHLGIKSQSTIRGYKKEANDLINAYLVAMKSTKNKMNEL